MNVPVPILFTSWYVGLGGGETHLLSLLDHLTPQQYEPHLLLPRDGQLGVQARKRGCQVHIIPYRGASVYFVPWLWSHLPVVSKLQQLIRQHHIQLVHGDYHTLPYVEPAAKRENIPVVWTVHGWWFHPKPWQRSFFRSINRTIAHSKAIRDGFLGHPPFVNPETVPIIYAGIDTNRFHPDNNGTSVRQTVGLDDTTPVVALIARFQDVKGHHIFQELVRRIAIQMPEVRFVVAGENIDKTKRDDTYKQNILTTHQNDPILNKRVQYLGFREDVEQVIGSADVVVCTSLFESFGRVNLEAMASGKPVVSTQVGGPAEIIQHGETGYLVPPDDIHTMAQLVILLLRNPQQRVEMGNKGRAFVLENFSLSQMAQQYVQEFAAVL